MKEKIRRCIKRSFIEEMRGKRKKMFWEIEVKQRKSATI